MGVTINGVTEHVLPSLTGNLYLSFWPRHIRILLLMRKIRPDLVHAHFIAKFGFHLLLLNVRPQVVSAWGDDVLILPKASRLIAWYTRRVLASVDLIYAVSEDIRAHIITDFSIPPGKIRYLPFGVDPLVFTPKETPAGTGRSGTILFSNRGFLPVYGMETLIRGFSLAYSKDPSLRLVLKGEGPEKDRLVALTGSLGLSGVVTFLERTRYADVPRDLQEADIFVTAATSDGTPVSLLEAMATGLPCIASSVGGVPEWVEDGRNGVLVPPSDPQALADAILALAKDPELCRLLGSRARETILKKGDWWRLMEEAGREYERLVLMQKKP
jgi:glycosyltransferase involved in cell wall biosynthesis